ncbi:AraC family transcriptional regulator [Chryseobacterium sp.]|uniref:helix-turn-helix domain-containing protein n=1 Tax=Chryseobacterium sp. TaxID=1871047 RepID=UPI003445B8B0
MYKNTQKNISRGEEITKQYMDFLDHHIDEVITGKTLDFMKLSEIADKLCISHKHLTDTVQKETGNHPCHFYDMKIISQVQGLLRDTDLSVSEIARTFTYDPSNFSKFFKKIVGDTPNIWRQKNRS